MSATSLSLSQTSQSVTSQQIYEATKGPYTSAIKPLMKTCGEIGSLKEAARLHADLYSNASVPTPTVEQLKEKRAYFDAFSKRISTANALALNLIQQLDKATADMQNRIVDPTTLTTIKERQPDLHSTTIRENEVCQKYLTEIKAWNAQLKIVANQIATRSADANKHVLTLFTIIDGKIKTLEAPNKTPESLTTRLAAYLTWGTTSNQSTQAPPQDGKGTEFDSLDDEIVVITATANSKKEVAATSKSTDGPPAQDANKADKKETPPEPPKSTKETKPPSSENEPEALKILANGDLFD